MRLKLGMSLLGAACIYVSSAAPSKRLLGATNGLAQTVASAQGTIVPAAADWLFAFSITNGVLGREGQGFSKPPGYGEGY